MKRIFLLFFFTSFLSSTAYGSSFIEKGVRFLRNQKRFIIQDYNIEATFIKDKIYFNTLVHLKCSAVETTNTYFILGKRYKLKKVLLEDESLTFHKIDLGLPAVAYWVYFPYKITLDEKITLQFIYEVKNTENIFVASIYDFFYPLHYLNNFYNAELKFVLPQDKKIILYAGSFYLYDWKGVDVLLEVAQKLNAENWLFVLVGGNAKEIKEIQNKYQLENILLVGHQPQNEIPIYLKAADILVLPNKKGFEASEKYTSPLKLFEYMASGRPIVASDLPSIREILNENNAVLVEPNNAKALAEGIKKVLSNPELVDKISQKAYEDVKNYTWGKRVSQILKWIDRQNRVL